MESKSAELIKELIKAKIITDRLCDTQKAQLIIRQHFCQVHKEAVEATEIAKNKTNYKQPNFYD